MATANQLPGGFEEVQLPPESALEFVRHRHIVDEYAGQAMTFLRSGVSLSQYVAQRLGEVRGLNRPAELSGELTETLSEQQKLIEQKLQADHDLASSPLMDS